MNMRGPFGTPRAGIFSATSQGILQGSDRPEVVHRGVHVLRERDGGWPVAMDKYPDATGWQVSDDGRLDVECVDARHVDIGSYPSGSWSRVWFPGAQHHVTRMKLPVDEDVPGEVPGEDENGEREDVEPSDQR